MTIPDDIALHDSQQRMKEWEEKARLNWDNWQEAEWRCAQQKIVIQKETERRRELEEANDKLWQTVVQQQTIIQQLAEALRMALGAFEHNDAIDWSVLETALASAEPWLRKEGE